MGFATSNGTIVGAILEGIEAKWRNCSVCTGNVHRTVDDVPTKVLEVQLDLGQVSGIWLPQLQEDAIEEARGYLHILPFLANLTMFNLKT